MPFGNRRIVLPIILATLMTLLSLKYYSGKRLEKQMSPKTRYRQSIDAPPSEGYDRLWKNMGRLKAPIDQRKPNIHREEDPRFLLHHSEGKQKNLIGPDRILKDPSSLGSNIGMNSRWETNSQNIHNNLIGRGKLRKPHPGKVQWIAAPESEEINHLRESSFHTNIDTEKSAESVPKGNNPQGVTAYTKEMSNPTLEHGPQKNTGAIPKEIGKMFFEESRKVYGSLDNRLSKPSTPPGESVSLPQTTDEALTNGIHQRNQRERLKEKLKDDQGVSQPSLLETLKFENIKNVGINEKRDGFEAMADHLNQKSGYTSDRFNHSSPNVSIHPHQANLSSGKEAENREISNKTQDMKHSKGSLGGHLNGGSIIGSSISEKQPKIELNNTNNPEVILNPYISSRMENQSRKLTGGKNITLNTNTTLTGLNITSKSESESVRLRESYPNNVQRTERGDRPMSVTPPSLQKIWDASIGSKNINNGHQRTRDHSENLTDFLRGDKKTHTSHPDERVQHLNSSEGNRKAQFTQKQLEGNAGRGQIPPNVSHKQNDRGITQISQLQYQNLNSSVKEEKHVQKRVNIWNEEIEPTRKSNKVADDEVIYSGDLPATALRSKDLKFRFKPEAGKKYAVISAVSIGDDFNYIFPLPLTVEAWRRIGYESIILLIGSEKRWMAHPILNYVLKELKRVDPIVVFLDSSPKYWIFLSQVSRLFVSELFDWRGFEMSDILLTTDVDIWPISKYMYELPQNKSILALNSYCCGNFKHKGMDYRMLPMCSVVMTVKTWREVLGLSSRLNHAHPVNSIITYFEEEFGQDLVSQPVTKGDNDGWYMDQHLISIKIKEWELQHGAEKIHYATRNVRMDRVDRSMWKPYGIERKKDVHLLENFYAPGTWERVLTLIRGMFPDKQQEMISYREGFIRNLLAFRQKKH